MSYEEVKSCLLKCEGPVISDNILQGLIQYLPPPDQLKKLHFYKDQYDDLTEAEQFCITVSAFFEQSLIEMFSIKKTVSKYLKQLFYLFFEIFLSLCTIDIDNQEIVAETEIIKFYAAIRRISARCKTGHSGRYSSLRRSKG